MTDKIDNSEAYGTIRWILDNGDMGFFFVIAPTLQQRKIANLFKSPNSAIYDYSKESKPFSYTNLSEWADSHAEQNIFFILNMDAALQDKSHIAALNMSRDLLARKEKIWFLSMTKDLENRITDYARDFYSYVRLKVSFHAEEEDEFEGKHILDFDGRHNVHQIQEALSRYKEMEARYMAMSFEKNTENELLSAAVALSNIATLYMDCAEYSKALGLLKKTKEIREKILERKHPDTAEVYNNIAFLYSEQGDFKNALEWYEKTLSIEEKVLGTEHPNTAVTYDNIAIVYNNQGYYKEALEWHKKALDIKEKRLGAGHPSTAITYINIGLVYHNKGDYNKSLDSYKKALPICERVLGKEHPETAAIYDNIALVYSNQENYSKALDWHYKALAVFENIRGKEHPSTAITYSNIAWAYRGQGDYSRALELFQKAYKIFLHKLGDKHPHTISVKRNIQSLSNM